jgi:tetratricopeptide (TPR) repeat protein
LARAIAVGCPDENTLLAFAEGRLSPATRAETAAHLDTCASCREVIAGVAPAILSVATRAPDAPRTQLARGAAVGRYVILSLVGRGGMGEVYAAYDPELDRKVALKLLHESAAQGSSPSRARARLLHEAQAIARLSHPNIVVVHDAGMVDDRVFIAMEFVDGQTLAVWLAEQPRTWREARDVYVTAGEALAAAHAAGLVHRDFKPQNVMVGKDGKIRVMDFGLASHSGDAEPAGGSGDGAAVDEGADPWRATQMVALTAVGTLVGTPGYMSPEQFRAERVDARSDQFSFCAALFEAVYGERPFAGKTVAELRASVLSGHIHEPASKRGAPAWMRRVILRGLRPDPADRFARMDDLLRALGRDPARRRRRALVAAGAGALLLAAGAMVQRSVTRVDPSLCRNASKRLHAIWEREEGGPTPRRDAIHAAFTATGKTFAVDAWQRVSSALDSYAGAWAAMYGEACEATHVRGEQSTQVLDLRMECLGAARASLATLTDIFAHADGSVVAEAVNAVAGLPGIPRCADVAMLRSAVPPPDNAHTAARVASLRRRLDVVRTLRETGQSAKALIDVPALVTEARTIGYQPALAETLFEAARVEDANARPEAEAPGKEAVWVALAAHDDDIAVQAAVMLHAIIGIAKGRYADAEIWGGLAGSLLTRLGPSYAWLHANLTNDRGAILMLQGELRGARADLEAAVAEKIKVYGPEHLQVGISLGALGDVLTNLGDGPAALAAHRRAIEIMTRTYGGETPAMATGLYLYGIALSRFGQPQQGIAYFQRVIALWQREFGDSYPRLAYPLTEMGRTLLAQGRPDAALPVLERALVLREKDEPDPIPVAQTRFALAQALEGEPAERERARRLAEEARTAYAAVPGLTTERAAIDKWLAATRP